ncbi:MAG: 30S ribosomal protein S6 [Elusimicrobia bacterium]|nr:30S ribosomal protein S6 [Elusimicrobiota bacterium]
MTTYETLVLVDPVLSDDELTKLMNQLGKIAAERHGKIVKEDRMGRRRLAYPVRKKAEGNYVCLHLELPSQELGEWQRQLRLHPNILRQLTCLP